MPSNLPRASCALAANARIDVSPYIANLEGPTWAAPSSTTLRASQQSRSYTVSIARDKTSNNAIHPVMVPLTPEEIKRNNLISTRLYRILLRSCLRDVRSANLGNKIYIDGNDCSSNSSMILLQPPFDIRKYGHANEFRVRKGELHSIDVNVASSDGELSMFNKSSYNSALGHMNRDEVGRAMDVLRFVHTSLGGGEDDDLEAYYLGSSDEVTTSESTVDNKETEADFRNKLSNNLGAAAGKHAEGHYTHFLDDDEERGEAPSTAEAKAISDDGELDEYESQHEELDDEYLDPPDHSVLVTSNDIANAIRIAFRAPVVPADEDQQQTMRSIITRRHRDAIDASSLLSEQINMWANKSSICINKQHGIRIVATSSQITGMRMGGKKYKFAYRIRVENINRDDDNSNKVVQLLGRTWNIYEYRTTNASLLTRLFQEDNLPKNEESDKEEEEGQEDIRVRTLIQNVHEPKTGAVGHFPVIRPGEVFEYKSGAELGTPTGSMEGCFHMATVDPEKTESASIGETIDALSWKDNDERKFETKVAEFGFVADGSDAVE